MSSSRDVAAVDKLHHILCRSSSVRTENDVMRIKHYIPSRRFLHISSVLAVTSYAAESSSSGGVTHMMVVRLILAFCILLEYRCNVPLGVSSSV